MMRLLYTSAPDTFQEPPAGTAPFRLTSPPPMSTKTYLSFFVATLLIGAITWAGLQPNGLSAEGALTLTIFVLAIWAWIFSSLSDTYVSLSAALTLVITGVISADQFTATLGTSTVWLLVAAVIMAHALTESGLTRRITAQLMMRARTPRQLAHCVNLALFLTAYLVPSPSGRAALALPLVMTVASVLTDRPKLIKALNILAPSTILVSAISSFIGAGAHLVTAEIITAHGLETIGFLQWVFLGSGLGFLASLLVTELVLFLFAPQDSTPRKISITPEDFEGKESTPVQGPMSPQEKKTATIFAITTLLWCTEHIHGITPVIVAILGALAVSTPTYGTVKLADGIKKAPWSMLLFMAATLAIGTALATSGAATWLAESIFAPLSGLNHNGATAFALLVITVSTAAHLVIQSRSARSAVLVPIIITAATPLGVNPVAAAFISTAAAGFCHTLTSSAKPIALFETTQKYPTYNPADLIKLSLWLAPLHMALIAVFAFWVWPALGLPLYL